MSNRKDFALALDEIEGAKVISNVSLSGYTTWKVGGSARYLVWAKEYSAVVETLRLSCDYGTSILVLGNGSNMLVSDDGFDGVVMRLTDGMARSRIEGDVIKAGAGVLLNSLATEAFRSGLSGLEFAFGIPGTVGGAIMLNAGAFGGSVSDVVEAVTALSMEGEESYYVEFEPGYRKPLIPENEVVLEAEFELLQLERDVIKQRMDEVRKQRRESQPWGMATAGSVFENPPGDYAGRLIEECGLKGKKIGGARISEIHANFIINEGDATASDIMGLIELAREEVRDRFGIDLALEVELVGFGEGSS